jgi:hypothetical protein
VQNLIITAVFICGRVHLRPCHLGPRRHIPLPLGGVGPNGLRLIREAAWTRARTKGRR